MKNKYTFLIAALLIVSSLVAYSLILDNGFVNYDDNKYIVENNHIKSGINTESVKWAFTTLYFGYWHPLTWLSHMLDWNLFGANASGHHLINLLLHIGTVLLLFFFMFRTTKQIWPSAFVSALFTLHPLRVESVAWAAERKDVLSMFFGMASIYAYSFYAENNRLTKYFICIGLFFLSLMSKPLLVTLPFILMLIDCWPLGRWTKDTIVKLIGEKIPFIFFTIVFSLVTVHAQNSVGAIPDMERLPFSLRILNAVNSYVSYLGKMFWPINLSVFYPYEQSFLLWQIIVCCSILLCITAFVVFYFKKMPFLFVGWFWYLGTLIPLIGLIQAGMHAMADRHTYLPSIGIAIMLAWGVPLMFPREKIRKTVLLSAGIVVLAILTVLTWRQCGYWKNSFELFNHALNVTKDNYVAYNSRGITYGEIGRYNMAISDFNEAIRLKPDYARAYNNRSFTYLLQGDINLGCSDARRACKLGSCKTLDLAKSKGYCR